MPALCWLNLLPFHKYLLQNNPLNKYMCSVACYRLPSSYLHLVGSLRCIHHRYHLLGLDHQRGLEWWSKVWNISLSVDSFYFSQFVPSSPSRFCFWNRSQPNTETNDEPEEWQHQDLCGTLVVEHSYHHCWVSQLKIDKYKKNKVCSQLQRRSDICPHCAAGTKPNQHHFGVGRLLSPRLKF